MDSIPGLCGYRKAFIANCPEDEDLRYGLYSAAEGIFNVSVNLISNPGSQRITTGVAALTDAQGNCPLGLIKIRPWLAEPRSITKGSLDGKNPESSFINTNQRLNDYIVEASENTRTTMQVRRSPNTGLPFPNGRCSNSRTTDPASYYSCENIVLDKETIVQTLPYISITPVVCAIPKVLLKGLF